MSVEMLRPFTPLMRAEAPIASDSNGEIVRTERNEGVVEVLKMR